MPEDFDAQKAFARVVHVLEAHTTYFQSIDHRLDQQGAKLDAVVERLDRLNEWALALTRRVKALEADVATLKRRGGA